MISVVICILLANLFVMPSKAAPSEARPLIIVLDPGHGGDSTGAEYFDTLEKDITIPVCLAAKEYLEKFDYVEVYLTRTEDVKLTYTQRVQQARGRNADIFISIHFNESDNHNRTGFEVWVPSDPKLQKSVMSVAESLAQNANNHIEHRTGIFSCKNNEGADYLGQLRRAAESQMPALIIQELYMDRAENKNIIHSEEELKEIGIQNAIAIARAYHLKSEALGLDFSDTKDIRYSAPVALTEEDYVYPSDVNVSLEDYEQTSDTMCTANFKVETTESSDKIAGYSYSTDRGQNYSGVVAVEECNSFTFSLSLKPDTEPIIRVLAYNKQGLCVTSNEIEVNRVVKLDPDFSLKKIEEAKEEAAIAQKIREQMTPKEPDRGVFKDEARFSPTKSIVIVFGAVAGLAICLILFVGQIKPKKKDKN